MEDQKLREKLDEGYIYCSVILEVAGKPKEHVVETMRLLISQIKEIKDIKLYKGDLFKPKQHEEVWSTFAELELLVKDASILLHFCFEYAPSSVEIIGPQNLNLKNQKFAAFLNDLVTRMHNIGNELKELKADNNALTKNATALFQNIMILTLRDKERPLSGISKNTGIPENQLKPFIDLMVKNKFLKQKRELYCLNK